MLKLNKNKLLLIASVNIDMMLQCEECHLWVSVQQEVANMLEHQLDVTLFHMWISVKIML